MKNLIAFIVFTSSLFAQSSVSDYNPELWLRYNIGITSNANGVATWADQSTHNRNWIQTTDSDAARPNVAGDGIDFNGSSNFLSAESTMFHLGTTLTIFVRMRIDQNKDFALFGGNLGTYMVIRHFPGNYWEILPDPSNANFRARFALTAADSTFKTYRFERTENTEFKFFIDGVLINRISFVKTANPDWLLRTMGKRYSFSDFYFNGRIAEIIIIPNILSASDVIVLENYLETGEFPANDNSGKFMRWGGWLKF